VGGLNELDLRIAFNDVDFCLRLKEAGYHNVWTPYAELYHHESATRGFEDTPEKQMRFSNEVMYMKRRWGDQLVNDPAYSPNLSLDYQDFSLAWPPRVEPFNLLPPDSARPGLNRVEKALRMIDPHGLGLEIGPSHNPLAPKRAGFKVHILDHASAEELRAKYAAHGVNLDNIEDVDFVWHGGPLHELIGCEQCYDWIIASHVIEHVPDLISFLQECEKLLKPNGVLSLVIPDKRYCFDYFNVPTSTGELLDAFDQKRKRPSPGKVFDHFAGAAHRDGRIAWGQTDTGPITLLHGFDEAHAKWTLSATSEDYIDVHNWRFTPSTFRLILADLQALGLTRLGAVREYDTEGCEFFVTLGKSVNAERQDRLVLVKNAVA
jgi:SAM-dependent methyltransferase